MQDIGYCRTRSAVGWSSNSWSGSALVIRQSKESERLVRLRWGHVPSSDSIMARTSINGKVFRGTSEDFDTSWTCFEGNTVPFQPDVQSLGHSWSELNNNFVILMNLHSFWTRPKSRPDPGIMPYLLDLLRRWGSIPSPAAAAYPGARFYVDLYYLLPCSFHESGEGGMCPNPDDRRREHSSLQGVSRWYILGNYIQERHLVNQADDLLGNRLGNYREILSDPRELRMVGRPRCCARCVTCALDFRSGVPHFGNGGLTFPLSVSDCLSMTALYGRVSIRNTRIELLWGAGPCLRSGVVDALRHVSAKDSNSDSAAAIFSATMGETWNHLVFREAPDLRAVSVRTPWDTLSRSLETSRNEIHSVNCKQITYLKDPDCPPKRRALIA
ncbi:hypothetical protein DFH07DRAFT_937024 [Mycena maculata]|uniref:Uncharacterized protein n=1 Tax=Mycena maculata TaxID=230809 RepID=A0AAD7NUU8_9AGAR|nr:hypothetical protein DFH07DRAFT_937024 [Mycena maculata]